jgi:HAMP domain-containing protein
VVANSAQQRPWRPLHRPTHDDEYVVIAIPVYGREAQIVVGVLYTSFHLNVLEDILSAGNNTNRHSELYFPQGRTVHVRDNIFLNQPLPPADQSALGLLWASEAGTAAEITLRDGDQLASWAAVSASDPSSRLTIAALGWRVVSYQGRESVLQAVGKAWQSTLMAGTAALILASLLASAFAARLTQPIARLTSAARRVADGELGVQAAVESGDEIGLLATAFNQMTHQLSHSMAALQQRTHMLETSAQVARAASASLALDDVLETTVQHISRQFGFYVASVFIVEPATQSAVLRASTHETLRERGIAWPSAPARWWGRPRPANGRASPKTSSRAKFIMSTPSCPKPAPKPPFPSCSGKLSSGL